MWVLGNCSLPVPVGQTAETSQPPTEIKCHWSPVFSRDLFSLRQSQLIICWSLGEKMQLKSWCTHDYNKKVLPRLNVLKIKNKSFTKIEYKT